MTNYHPAVNFIYFLTVIVFSVIIMNPIFIGISFVCACLYAIYLNGMKSVKFGLALVLPLIILSVIINPIVNQRGATILFELPLGLGSATFESVIYGLTTGLMIGSVIMWFVSYNIVITSDKLIFLFGRILPGSSLIFVMILRFIPRYREQIKKINEAQTSIGMGIGDGGLLTKIKNGARILGVMFTWALENAIQTADSMRARGYGLKNRTSYMAWKITSYDKVMLVFMGILIVGIISGMSSGYMSVEFFPYFMFGFEGLSHAPLFIFGSTCLCFGIFAVIPIIIGLKELLYWNQMETSTSSIEGEKNNDK